MAIYIGNNEISPLAEPFTILEAGINHNGQMPLALEMIHVAKQAGADAIKFQTFRADEFVGDPTLTFTYQSQGKQVTESMLEMFRRYEFQREQWFEIRKACDEVGIQFLSTPQNASDLSLLIEVGVPAVKVGSDDFTNLPLLKHYASTGLPLIISCGMADLGEVYEAIEATGALKGNPVMLMLCTSQYPTPPEDVNLLKLKTLAGAFPGLVLGFSDHTQGSQAAAMACGLGACIFEKHFTLDRDLPGPDHWFSENPESARHWVSSIKSAKSMLGSAVVSPTPAERDMRRLARRSVTVLKNIAVGELLNNENLGLRRPGNGLPPKFIDLALGHRARNPLVQGQQLAFGDIE